MITVVGSLNMDLVLTCERIPGVGETVIGNEFQTFPGGKGANQAVAASRLGAETVMIGKIGDDEFGQRILHSLQESGVDTSYVLKSSKKPTGVAAISVDSKGGNSIIVASGANFDIHIDEVKQMDDVLSKSDILILQNEIDQEVNRYLLSTYGNKDICIVYNPAPAVHIEEEYLHYIDFLIPNEHEIKRLSSSLSDEMTYEEYIRYYLSKGVKNMIVTLGEEGCMFADSSSVKSYPAQKVEAVDTTAAGDTFVGGFCAEYLNSKNVEAAIDFAMRSARLSVMRKGAQSSIPYRKEVNGGGRE